MKFNKYILGKLFAQNTEEGSAPSSRYSVMSRIYYLAGLALLGVLVIFLLMSVIFGFREFTYQNFYFFFKDLDSTFESGLHSGDMINYGYEENRVYAPYKGGVAVAGKYTVAIYSPSGRRTALFTTGYSAPSICTSSKYLMVYDSKSGEYSVYNSFIRLDGQSLRSEIYDADISNDGEILIHTADSNGSPVAYLYDSEGDMAAKYTFENVLICSALSDDGKHIAAAELGTANGGFSFVFNLYQRHETQPQFTIQGDGEMPLFCEIIGSRCILITSRSVRIVDMNGNVVSQFVLPEQEVFHKYAFDDKGVAITSFDGTLYRLIYLPISGKGVVEYLLDAVPTDLTVSDGEVYVLCDGEVIIFQKGDKLLERMECQTGADGIFAALSGQVYICYSSYAVRLR